MDIKIIVLFSIIYSLKAINKQILISRNFNSFRFSAILNMQIADIGKTVYLTRNNSVNLTIFQKYDITQTPKLLHTFTQPISINQSNKNQLFYVPKLEEIYAYNQLNSQQILYNSTSFQYLDNFPYSIGSIVYSLNFNMIFFIDINKKLYYLNKNQFQSKRMALYLSHHTSDLVDLNNYPMQFSPDQSLLIIVDMSYAGNLYSTGFYIYNVTPTIVSLFRFLLPQNIVTNGSQQQISSISWKNNNQVYVLYGLQDATCNYNILIDVFSCQRLLFSARSMIYFSYDDQLIFFIINSTNPTNTSYTIMFTDSTTLIYKHHISDYCQFQIVNARFKQINDTLLISIKGLKSAEILLVKQNCPTGFYYDSCKSSCMIFHQSCTTLDTLGCSCKTGFQNKIQIQFQQEKNIIKSIVKNQVYIHVNQITGMRGSIRIISEYFIQLADFFLYSYHDREYNFIINHIIIPIKQLQQRKWKLFQINKKLLQRLMSLEIIKQQSPYKQKFTPKKYFKFEKKVVNFSLMPQSFLFLIQFYRSLFFQQSESFLIIQERLKLD